MAILRPWRISDIPDVARCAANPKIAANLRDCFPYPYTEADARDYVTSCIQAGESRQLCRRQRSRPAPRARYARYRGRRQPERRFFL